MTNDVSIIIYQILSILKPFEFYFATALGSVVVVALGFLIIKYIVRSVFSYFCKIADGNRISSYSTSYEAFYWETRRDNGGSSLFPSPWERDEMIAQGKVYNTNTGEWEDRV